MMKFRKNQKGFTLIEALIVVIIVAILAALGIARFLGVREKTAQATCFSHQSSLNASYKKWTLDHPGEIFSAAATEALPGVAGSNANEAYIDAGSPTCPNGGIYGYVRQAIVGVGAEYTSICNTAGAGLFAGHGSIIAPTPL